MDKLKKYRVGYTQGVYDMFHIGHLNLLKESKKQCDFLIVGVNSDELVKNYKNKIPVITENCRIEIIGSIKYVDHVILTDTLDKVKIYEKIKFDAIFIGDDWKGTERWNQTENELAKLGVDVVYVPYTKNISSTILKERIKENGVST